MLDVGVVNLLLNDGVIDGGVKILVIIGSNSVWFDGVQLLEQTMTELHWK